MRFPSRFDSGPKKPAPARNVIPKREAPGAVDDQEDSAGEREKRRGRQKAVPDPLDVHEERGRALASRGGGAHPEELDHEAAADPDDGHDDVEEQQNVVTTHWRRPLQPREELARK
jgi:hypothetical protein